MAKPFLQCHRRFKNGKDHCYWSIAEKVRTQRGLGATAFCCIWERSTTVRRAAWTKTVEVFDTTQQQTKELALYPAEHVVPEHALEYGVQVRLSEFELRRAATMGALAGWVCQLWEQLQLDEFWRQRLVDSREGTSWCNVLQSLTVYRLIDPGSEWRLHREWFKNSALADLLEADFSVAQKDNLYRCLDKVAGTSRSSLQALRQRWKISSGVKFEVLLYDLTSSILTSEPPFGEGDKRRYGHSRDKRSDCVQVVIALVVTPEGFPLAYEVMAGQHLGPHDVGGLSGTD